jgi:hypothetical protein
VNKIQKLKKGFRPTLLETSKGNELIDHINALQNVTIQRGSRDEVLVTSNGVQIIYDGQANSTTGATGTVQTVDSQDPTKSIDLNVIDGIIESIGSGVSTLTGIDQFLELLDPTDLKRLIRISIQGGFVKGIEVVASQFEFTSVEVCINGQNQTKEFLTLNKNNPAPQPIQGASGLLNNYYTSADVDQLFTDLYQELLLALQ